MDKITLAVVACLLQVCLAGPVVAQESLEESAAPGRFHLGPLRFTPTLTFAGPGVDTNVFNEFDEPKQDWTAHAAPKADWFLRMGRGLLTASTGLEYQYFAKYDNQRALNTDNTAKIAVLLGRFTPFVSGSYANARMRPSYEIDIRARQVGDGLSLGSEVLVLSRTTLVLSATRSFVRFDRKDVFLGTNLAEALDRRTDTERADARQRLSALTTLVLRAEATSDRFDVARSRNADSVAVMPGLEFKPFALIKGKAFVGYRSFRPLDPAVPDFRGLVASVDLAYAVSDTRLAVQLSRDVSYSFQHATPYYLLTDVSARVTQMVTEAWDIDANAGWQQLDYQMGTTGVALPNESGLHGGAGTGRWFGRNLRLGFDINVFRRRSSPLGLRNYHSLQAGFSVKYGLKP